MALTPSNMLPLGTSAPDFELPDPQNKLYTRDQCRQTNGLIVVFMCNHCPYVQHLKPALAELGRRAADMQIGMVGISANDIVNYPDDAPQYMANDVQQYGYTFPYLFDEDQQVAKAYDAACTPDFYVFNGDLELVYRGQFDASRPGNNVPVTGDDLYQALTALHQGQPVNSDQTPSVGCNIKWK